MRRSSYQRILRTPILVLVALLVLDWAPLAPPAVARTHADSPTMAAATMLGRAAAAAQLAPAPSQPFPQPGAPDNVLGYAPFPSTLANPVAPEGFYLENKGPYEYKEYGDAYSPLWESYVGRTFLPGADIAGVTDPCSTLTAMGNCVGANGSTTINGDNSPSSSTVFSGYDYIVDDPLTNTMVVKLFDPYDEIDYNTRARTFDQTYGFAHNLAYAPGDSNTYTATNLATDSTQLSSTGPCILGGTPTGSPPTCPTTKLIDENGSGAFGRHATTLQFSLFGPGSSPGDQNMPQITTQVTGTATQATCAISNCVYQAPFAAGSDPTTCGVTSCPSPYAYRFVNYAVVHGPGIFRLNVRSIANADGTFGTEGNAFGIAACAALNADNTWRENLGDTSDPYINNGAAPGWNANSCLNPNDPANGGDCSNPANPAPGELCVHVYGLGKMAIHSWLSAGNALIPLGYVPPQYAGQTLLVRLYDVGDVGASVPGSAVQIEALTPAGDLNHLGGTLDNGYPAALPYTYQASDADGSSPDQGYLTNPSPISATASQPITTTTSTGTSLYNGTWLNVSIPLVVTGTNGYGGLVQNFGGYWRLLYSVGGVANDGMTIVLAAPGTPVTPTQTPTTPPSDTPTAIPSPTTTPAPTNTATPAAALLISPTTAAPFQTIALTGTNFAAGEHVKVYWDSAATAALTSTRAGGVGGFAAHLVVPQAVSGAHTVIAVGQTSAITASTAVQLKPTLLLAPSSQAAGGAVVARGFGFGGQERVKVSWDSPARLLGVTTSTALGSFYGATALTFTVPLSAPPGQHVVYGVGQVSHAVGTAVVIVAAVPTQTPTPAPTDTPTSTPSLAPTDTSTPAPTDTSTQTPVPTDTPTDTPTSTPSPVPTDTPTTTATSTPSPTTQPTPNPGNPTVGANQDESGGLGADKNNLTGSRLVMGFTGGTPASMSVYLQITAPGKRLRFGIYSDYGGAPLALLCQTTELVTSFPLPTTGWVALPFSSCPALQPYTTYWLMMGTDSNTLWMYYDTLGGASWQGAILGNYSSAGLPNVTTFAGTLGTRNYSLFLTFQ